MFKVIYADPPWPENTPSGKRYGAHLSFPTMEIDRIESIPVHKIADPNGCALFLWTTWRHVMMAGRVMKAWGFRYAAEGFVWEKVNKNSGEPEYNIGFYSFHCTEPCLLAIRGSGMVPVQRGVKSLVRHPRTKENGFAAKPSEVRRRIELMYPPDQYPSIELFARNHYPNWTCVGNEIDGCDIHDAVNKLYRQLTAR